jgi:hypothetical protein
MGGMEGGKRAEGKVEERKKVRRGEEEVAERAQEED